MNGYWSPLFFEDQVRQQAHNFDSVYSVETASSYAFEHASKEVIINTHATLYSTINHKVNSCKRAAVVRLAMKQKQKHITDYAAFRKQARKKNQCDNKNAVGHMVSRNKTKFRRVAQKRWSTLMSRIGNRNQRRQRLG